MGNNYDITELLRTKSYSDLNPEERAFVQNQLEGEAEYNAMRNIVLKSKDDLNLNSEAKDAVMAAFDQEFGDSFQQEPKNKRKLWPYIAAAASVIVLLVIGNLFMNEKEGQFAENKTTQKIGRLDTDTVVVPEEKSDSQAAEVSEVSKVEEERNVDSESDQIAELKIRDDKEMNPEGGQFEFNDEIDSDEGEIHIKEEESIQDVIRDEEIAELEEDAAAEPTSVDMAKSKKALSDEVPALSDASSRSITTADVQRITYNAAQQGPESAKNWQNFKLKRINKDHYTSY